MSIEKLNNSCLAALKEKGLENETNIKRLKEELKEIEVQNGADYFLELQAKKQKYENENNLFVAYLLDITDKVDLEKEPNYIAGDTPDIDIDYVSSTRSYLKDKFTTQTYGEDYVCNIATYTTFGLRSALIDMARVLGLDRVEVMRLTTSLGVKDDEGETLTWDKALEIYDDLREYLEKNPELADAAKRLINRNRNIGQHASGVIISGKPIKDFVPLVMPKGATVPCAAWVEGLHGTDLGAVGLVKFDFLSLDGNYKNALTVKQMFDRLDEGGVGVEFTRLATDLAGGKICALPGRESWSDTRYLEDPDALAMADRGDLKTIFQFDGSEGIRRLTKSGGVTRFDDMVAYTALYRPGPMKLGYHNHFCNRKKGKEKYEVHPLLADFMSSTYGVLCYQEQCMRMLHVVGKIPLKDCETVRKAISKKKVDKFIKYKDMFVANGQETLGWSKQEVEHLWMQIEAFAGYAFNASVDKNTLIPTIYGLKRIQDFKPGDIVYSVDELGNTTETEVINLYDHGMLDGYEVTFDDGYSITCSLNHKFLTQNGQTPLWEIIESNTPVLCDPGENENASTKKKRMENSVWNDISKPSQFLQPYCRLSKMQRLDDGKQVDELQTNNKMRAESFNKTTMVRSPETMPKMQRFGLEERNRYSRCSVWFAIQNMERKRKSPEELSGVFNDREQEYSTSHAETNCEQRITRTKIHHVDDGSQNFSTPRNPRSQSRTIKKVARGESREVCGDHSDCYQIFQEIQKRIMVERADKMGKQPNSLWRRKETSGFCTWQHMDRSRWLLPLFQTEFNKKRIKNRDRSATRSHVEYRSDSTGEHNVDSVEHGMFRKFNRNDEIGMDGYVSDYAEIRNTRRLVSRKIVQIVPVGKRQMYDLEVACSTHNFLLPNGIATSNSHAVAYCYISSRQLYLKCHHPIEFYSSVISCTNPAGPKDYLKLKDYKREAEKHGVRVEPVHLNISGYECKIVDNKVYYGFSKIRGIGEDTAKRLVELQPYTGFADFLTRFGTESKVVSALIALGQFTEADNLTLYAYYEAFKDHQKKMTDRKKRFEIQSAKYELECQLAESSGDSKLINKTREKLERAQENYENKKTSPPSICDFKPSDELGCSEELLKALTNLEQAEQDFYGFPWKHPLEKSPDYQGFTVANFFQNGWKSGPLEILVNQVEQRTKKITFWSITGEDADGEVVKITLWDSEFPRFANLIKVGNSISIRVKAPDPPFRNFTLLSYGNNRFSRKSSYSELDSRVVLLKRT